VTSCHNYTLTSSVPDDGCRKVYNNQPKISGKPFQPSVPVVFPEATRRLSMMLSKKTAQLVSIRITI
jgi:hypothetical protein